MPCGLIHVSSLAATYRPWIHAARRSTGCCHEEAGLVTFGTIHGWDPGIGSVISWHATPTACAKARQAPISVMRVSYQQTRHLRGFCEFATRGLDMARRSVGVWDIAGLCDVPAINSAITARLCRHDAHRSWFERQDPGRMVRRTFSDTRPGNSKSDLRALAARAGRIQPSRRNRLTSAA